MMNMTPVENLMLPTEAMTLSPATTNAHIRPATLPRTHSRVLLLGKLLLIRFSFSSVCAVDDPFSVALFFSTLRDRLW